MWRAAEGIRWAPLLLITAGTGMRQNEGLGLKWSDVDFERATLLVQRQLKRTREFKAPRRTATARSISPQRRSRCSENTGRNRTISDVPRESTGRRADSFSAPIGHCCRNRWSGSAAERGMTALYSVLPMLLS